MISWSLPLAPSAQDMATKPPKMSALVAARQAALQAKQTAVAQREQVAATKKSFNEKASQQFRTLQRMQDRQEKLEEVMTPDYPSYASTPASGAASFAAAFQQRRDSTVSAAVDRMQELLSTELNIAVQESDDEWMEDAAYLNEASCSNLDSAFSGTDYEGSTDEGVESEMDDDLTTPGAPVLGKRVLGKTC